MDSQTFEHPLKVLTAERERLAIKITNMINRETLLRSQLEHIEHRLHCKDCGIEDGKDRDVFYAARERYRQQLKHAETMRERYKQQEFETSRACKLLDNYLIPSKN